MALETEYEPKTEWYQKQRAIIVLLVLFPPVGLILMWKYGRWGRVTKQIVTLVTGFALLVVLTVAGLLVFGANQKIATWIQALALVAALGAIILVWLQIRSADFSQSVTLILELEKDFSSDSMLNMRRAAARHLLNADTERNGAVNRVLNFFEMVAFMVDRGALDEYTVWHKFYNRIDGYWWGSEYYIKERRRSDRLAYRSLQLLHARLRERTRRELVERGHTAAELDAHLKSKEEDPKRWLETEVNFNPNVSLIFELENEFSSDSMLNMRRAAARHLLNADTERSNAVNRVLNFFEMVAFMLDRGALDEETVWHSLYSRFEGYWWGSESYIKERRKSNPSLYKSLQRLNDRLQERSRKEYKAMGYSTEKIEAYTSKTEEEIANWLKTECDTPSGNRVGDVFDHITVDGKQGHERKSDSKNSSAKEETIKTNLSQFFDKAYEEQLFKDLADAPVDALQGLSSDDAETLKRALGIGTIRELAENDFVRVAQAVVALSR